jgi:hypothetical protein
MDFEATDEWETMMKKVASFPSISTILNLKNGHDMGYRIALDS